MNHHEPGYLMLLSSLSMTASNDSSMEHPGWHCSVPFSISRIYESHLEYLVDIGRIIIKRYLIALFKTGRSMQV